MKAERTTLGMRALPRDLKARATVMQVTAAAVDMFFTLASTARAAAGPRKAIVWICFLTFVAGTPGSTYGV